MNTMKILSALAALSLSSCVSLTPPPLEKEAWADMGEGTSSYGFGSGWAFYGAEIQAAGTGGVLAGESGTDNTDLAPRYGGALKVNHFFTDDISVGLIAELRAFEADPISPLTATLTADPFETIHLLLSGRYWFDARGEDNRLKPFIGADIGYIPGVDFGSVRVDYPTFPSEYVDIEADGYYSAAAVVGASYLWNDHMSVDFGAFYEFPLTAGETELTFPNLGDATSRVEVAPEGLICFFGLTFYL